MNKIVLFLILLSLTACAPSTYRSRYSQRVPKPMEVAIAPPIAQQRELKEQEVTIVIDPGHGGKDEGAHGTKPKYQEKQLTLLTSLMLRKYLEGMGYRIIITRSDDTFIPLKARSCFANSNSPDLFVSVHYNAAKSTDASGIEVFYYNSDKEKERSTKSKVLADNVLKTIIGQTKAKSRGVKHGDLAVVRETNMPAILIEGGFLTNEEERAKILDPNYTKRLAWGIAIGVREYIRQRV